MKDFWEIHDNLPMEQRQALIDHMVRTLTGKSPEPLIFTKSITISNDLPLDERIKITAQAYGVDPEQIDKKAFVEGEDQLKESKIRIMKFIKDFYGQSLGNGQRNKDDEILSVGKFLYTTEIASKLDPSESPDFILDNEIGLEHTRLEAEVDKQYISEIWKKYLNGAVSMLLNDIPNLKGLANLTLDTDSVVFEGKSLRDFKAKAILKNLSAIHQMIKECLIGTINGTNFEKPTFIKSLEYQQSNEAFVLKCNQEYFARTDFESMLKASINKKEQKLSVYQEQQNLKSWWLLIVYNESGASSAFKISELSISKPIQFSFDRIFVLNSFNLACYEVLREKPYLNPIAKKQYLEPKIHPSKSHLDQ